MNVRDMHRRVNLRVQKIASNVNDNFHPQEIDIYLNRATTLLIKERLEPLSNRLGKGFEQSQKRIDDLRTLVKKNEELDANEGSSNDGIEGIFSDVADFPDDYNYLLNVRFRLYYAREGIDFTVTDGKREPDGDEGDDYKERLSFGSFYQSDDIYTSLEDPLNTTSPKRPIFDVSENGITVYTDDTFLVDKIIINYLKEPATIEYGVDDPEDDVDSDLPETLHEEIVDKAAQLILSEIEKFGPEGLLQSTSKSE